MKGLFREFLLIFCACILGGTHWAVLQVGAWTRMAVSSAGRGGVGWEEIVSGQKPCHLCHAIDAGRRQEQGDDRNFPVGAKMVFGKYCEVDAMRMPVQMETGTVEWWVCAVQAEGRLPAPETPPPRA